MPASPDRLVVPDWMVRGDSRAQDTRCPAVGKRLMSSPISAMMTWALRRPTPVISSRRCNAGTAFDGEVEP